MMPSFECCWLIGCGLVQLLGLLAVLGARWRGSSLACQGLFFASLIAVLAATTATILIGGSWFSSGVTLGVMCVGVTFDW